MKECCIYKNILLSKLYRPVHGIELKSYIVCKSDDCVRKISNEVAVLQTLKVSLFNVLVENSSQIDNKVFTWTGLVGLKGIARNCKHTAKISVCDAEVKWTEGL